MRPQVRLTGVSILSLFAFSTVPLAPVAASAINEIVQTQAGKISGAAVEDGGTRHDARTR